MRSPLVLRSLPLFLALAALGLASRARADTTRPGAGLRGFEAELPVRSEGAACPTQAQLSLWAAADAARAAWLPLRDVQRAEVAGLQLSDDARVLAHVKRVLGATPPAGWSRAKGCASALCALTAALDGSQEAALWVLAIGADGGPVASLDQAPFPGAASAWRPGELRMLARALSDLPWTLKKQAAKLSTFRRIPDGQDPYQGSNAWSTRDGVILLRDTVWKMSERQQRQVIAHELGHHVEFARGSGYPISHSGEWLAFMGWELVGDPKAKDGYRIRGSDATATAVPSEEFPNTIDDYRYASRLMRTYSPPRWEYLKKLYGGVEFLKPKADPGMDAVFAKLGGPLAVFNDCAGLVQRSSRKTGWLQSELYLVRWKGSGSTWAKVGHTGFITRSPCVGMALEKLRETPEWKALSCKRDDEDLVDAAASRLAEVWGAYAEAASALQRSVTPERTAACLSRGELGVECFGGPAVRATAEAEARKLAAEFAPGQAQTPEQLAALSRKVLVGSVLAPTDEELIERFPVLGSTQDYLGACLAGVVEVSTPKGKPDWKYWVKNPPVNDVRGFTSPLASKACPRDFAAYLKTRGVTLDVDDPLFEHLAYLLKIQSGPALAAFNTSVLAQWPSLLAACGMAPAAKATPAQQPCAQAFLSERLAGVVPPGLVPAIAKLLSAQLRGP